MNVVLDTVYAAAALATSPIWGYRLLRTGKWRTDWAGRFAHGLTRPNPGHGAKPSAQPARPPTLLIHAVSVGEVNAIRGLIGQLQETTAGYWRIIISSTTDTGFARAQQLFQPRHEVVRYPIDFSGCVRRFLDAVQPDLVALTELEVWPNFVGTCQRRGIPVCVINGRLSDRSFRRYRCIRSLLRPTFAKLSVALVQSEAYAARFRALGVPADQVVVVDSMKWDAAPGNSFGITPQASMMSRDRKEAGLGSDEHGRRRSPSSLAIAMGIDPAKPLIVAGSTGPGEESMLIAACPDDVQLMFVPRKPERFEEVAQLAPDIVRRSRHPDGAAPPRRPSRLFLVDTMGELLAAYALADVAVVGRSFMGDLYGSNPLEPIALSKPTIIGPYYDDFTDIVEALTVAGGIEVTDQPGRVIGELLADLGRARTLAEQGLRVIQDRRGATARHVERLINLMPKRAQEVGSRRLDGHHRHNKTSAAAKL